VIQLNNSIIPVEVKSGDNSRLKSLHFFMDKAPHDVAIRVWSQPLRIDNLKTETGKKFRLISIPFYLAGKIAKVIESQNKL
jgi:hypothetical protein